MGAQPDETDRLLAMAGGRAGETLAGLGAAGRQRFALRVLGCTAWGGGGGGGGQGMEERMREAVERINKVAGEDAGLKALSVEGRSAAVEALAAVLAGQARVEPLGEFRLCKRLSA